MEVSGFSVPPLSSCNVSPNNQRASNIKRLLRGLVSKHTQRGDSFEKYDIYTRGLIASPLDPTFVSPSGSSSAFTSTPSSFKSFYVCSTSYRKRKNNSPLRSQCPLFSPLHEKELPFGNGSQPCKNVGRPQTTTCCFAMQFDSSLRKEAILDFENEKEKSLKERGEWKKRWHMVVVLLCAPDKSGKYHLLPPFIGILVQLTLLSMGPSSPHTGLRQLPWCQDLGPLPK